MAVDVRSAPPQHRQSSRRVLVVDDSPVMLMAAQLGLGQVPGWDVATSSSGRDAVELADGYQPDAILLDVMMPGQDGVETLRELRAQASTHDTPVVFLTALDDGARLVELGAAGVIAKPFEPGKLASQLSEVLGWPS
jgi:CheY-like chemotaxis protein